MNIFSKLFGSSKKEEEKAGGMEDFMTLIRVYFQAAIAADLGITNLAVLPDLRVFKATLHVPTVNNKLGVGEKSRCRKMLKDIYERTQDTDNRGSMESHRLTDYGGIHKVSIQDRQEIPRYRRCRDAGA